MRTRRTVAGKLMALFYVRVRPGDSRSVLWLLGAGRDCLFTAVTEMEGHCATGADGPLSNRMTYRYGLKTS